MMSQDETHVRTRNMPVPRNCAAMAVTLTLSVLGGGVAVLVFVCGFAVYDWVAIPFKHQHGPHLPPYWNILVLGIVPVFVLGAIGEFILAGKSKRKAVMVVAIIGPLAAIIIVVAAIAQLNP